jgi:hypothetical protein
MNKSVDKYSKTGIIHVIKEQPMRDFATLRQIVLTERAAQADADAKLSQELHQTNQPAVTFSGQDQVDQCMDWLNQ